MMHNPLPLALEASSSLSGIIPTVLGIVQTPDAPGVKPLDPRSSSTDILRILLTDRPATITLPPLVPMFRKMSLIKQTSSMKPGADRILRSFKKILISPLQFYWRHRDYFEYITAAGADNPLIYLGDVFKNNRSTTGWTLTTNHVWIPPGTISHPGVNPGIRRPQQISNPCRVPYLTRIIQ